MADIQAALKRKGRRGYAIPDGGSNLVGLFGYLEGFAELDKQCSAAGITDIAVTCGSGGTACGLALANRLLGSPYRIWAVAICDDAQYFYHHVQGTLDALALPWQALDLVTVVEGFKGKGYGEFGPEHVDFIRDVAVRSGVVLDPTYTGKGAFALRTMLWSVKALRGAKMAFVHTGGVFGLMDGRVRMD
jgi:1-aminocyclopropane-1-carboxylate deaminase/D-cysteine desulfhydrase-like pyridoxal-dependent ACC family enzyme